MTALPVGRGTVAAVTDPLLPARVRAGIRELVREHTLASPSDLLTALEGRGLDLGPEPEDLLDELLDDVVGTGGIEWCPVLGDDGFVGDPVLVDLRALVEGVTWTVPIDGLSLTTDTLAVADLGLLYDLLIEDELRLDTGETVELAAGRPPDDAASDERDDSAEDDPSRPPGERRRTVFVGLPHGWLADHGAVADGHLALSVRDGRLHGAPASLVPDPTDALAALLRDAAQIHARVDADGAILGPARAGPSLASVLASVPGRAGLVLPPLDRWVAAAQLSQRNVQLAPAGFDFDLAAEESRIDFVAYAHGFDADESEDFAVLSLAALAWRAGDLAEHPQLGAAAVEALETPRVALAFLEEELGTRLGPDTLARFGGDLLAQVDGAPGHAGLAWLLAEVAGIVGDLEEQEAWIDLALRADRSYPLAVHDKAWFAFDRGDAQAARSLLGRLDADVVAHDLAILDRALQPATATVGRNEPCPCGSGRKYKQCHLGRVAEPALSDRLTWLYRKACWWMERRHMTKVYDIQWARAGGFHGDHEGVSGDPLIEDLALVEDGLFEAWLDERGSLLPVDEALLASQWALVERSVFEVTDVRPGVGMTLRDLRTGDVLEVDERSDSRDARVGAYVLTRALPTGDDRRQLFGGITRIPDSARDATLALLDGEPIGVEVATFVAGLESGPSFVNFEGHPTVLCALAWQVGGRRAGEALDAELGAHDRSDGDDPVMRWTWSKAVEGGVPGTDGPTIRATLELEGDILRATTNSAERADELRALIERLLPGAVLLEDIRATPDEVRADAALLADYLEGDESDAGPRPHDLPPEVRAELWKQIERSEEAWLDESLPALGGATPREALDDPTRRDDLVRLLEYMDDLDAHLPDDEDRLGMRVWRLRALLGLERRPGDDVRLPGL